MPSTKFIKPVCDDFRSVARALTIVENNLAGAGKLLKELTFNTDVPVIGVTGPPGAGKSTLVNKLIDRLLQNNNKVAVLAIDPTSPFNFGSLLGDRIRMAQHFNHPDVFIRSVATRGSLGGLSAKTIEMTDVLRSAGFDYIIVETVGVGQSEVEIAGLADVTILVLVPESGDEIQNVKSGLMEIADAYIINKADRPDADTFFNNLKKVINQQNEGRLPVFKTVASSGIGIDEIVHFLLSAKKTRNERRYLLLTEKVYKLIQEKRMEDVDKKQLQEAVIKASSTPEFNMYIFLDNYTGDQ